MRQHQQRDEVYVSMIDHAVSNCHTSIDFVSTAAFIVGNNAEWYPERCQYGDIANLIGVQYSGGHVKLYSEYVIVGSPPRISISIISHRIE